VVTEHRAYRCCCAACGTQTRAAFPAAVGAPVQYGPRLAAFVVYLMSVQFLPEDRLATLMADLFGVLLSRACHAVTLAKQQKTALRARMVALITRRYDAIVASSTAWHEALPPLAGKTNRDGSLSRKQPRRVGHNLLIRLSHRTEDVLRFLTNPQVPFTNDQAERDLRMMKLRQKISGGFRSYQGALDFAALRTTIGTAKKQGWNVIESLMQTPDALLQKLRAA
jgi:transposase